MCVRAVIRMQQHQIFTSRSTCFQPKTLAWKVLEVRKKRCQTHWIFSLLLKHKHPQQFHNILYSSGSWAGRPGEIPRTPPEWHMCSYILLSLSPLSKPWWFRLLRQPSLIFSSFFIQDLHSSVRTTPSLAALWLSLVTMSCFHFIK